MINTEIPSINWEKSEFKTKEFNLVYNCNYRPGALKVRSSYEISETLNIKI